MTLIATLPDGSSQSATASIAVRDVLIVGLDAESVFSHPDVRVWRKLPDRDNATLDADVLATDMEHSGIGRGDGRVRLHIKRYGPARTPPAKAEVAAFQLLQRENIPTAPLVPRASVRAAGSGPP